MTEKEVDQAWQTRKTLQLLRPKKTKCARCHVPFSDYLGQEGYLLCVKKNWRQKQNGQWEELMSESVWHEWK